MNKRNGFSIIELLTVIFIIALMALMGFAVFKNFRERTSVSVAARDVVNIMRLARRKAVTERTDYLAIYDLKNEKVWTQDPNGPDGIKGTADDFDASDPNTWNPDFGTEQALPDMAIIARVKAGTGGQASNPGTPDPNPMDAADTGTAYHKFSPKSTVTAGSVWLKDEGLKNFYKVTLKSPTARARIYDSWED